jgi:hypothetical protein
MTSPSRWYAETNNGWTPWRPHALTKPLDFVYCNGGDDNPDPNPDTNICVPRAIAIITGRPLHEVCKQLEETPRDYDCWTGEEGPSWDRTSGTDLSVIAEYLEALGFFGPFNSALPPTGRLLIRLDNPQGGGHVTALVNGTVHDTWDCRKYFKEDLGAFWSFLTPIPGATLTTVENYKEQMWRDAGVYWDTSQKKWVSGSDGQGLSTAEIKDFRRAAASKAA